MRSCSSSGQLVEMSCTMGPVVDGGRLSAASFACARVRRDSQLRVDPYAKSAVHDHSAAAASGLLPTTREYKTRETCTAVGVTSGATMHIANFAQAEIDEMFERIDENGDRCISFDEYARLMIEIDHDRPESACGRASIRSTRITTAGDSMSFVRGVAGRCASSRSTAAAPRSSAR